MECHALTDTDSPNRGPGASEQPATQDGFARITAGSFGIGIFLIDLISPLGGAVAVLYVLVLLIVARTGERRDILIAGACSIAGTITAYLFGHGGESLGAPAMRAAVSLSAISVAMALMLRIQASTARLSAQAGLLDLSHDMIFMRDMTGRIRFWNRGAELVYGWTSAEALGKVADALLQTRHETDRAETEAALARTGRWEGGLQHTTRAGARIFVDSRWAVQRDRRGRVVGILETNTDVTDKRAQYDALARSERRFRRMFDSSRIGIVQEDWSAVRRALRLFAAETGLAETEAAARPEFVDRARRLAQITDVNPAFLTMIGVSERSALLDRVHDLLSVEDRSFGPALAAWIGGEPFHEGETRLVHANGSPVSVLFTMTFPSAQDEDGSVLIFSMDVTEQRMAQDALIQARTELAHAARVATLGELSASIAHEVNQPLMAIVTSGEAGLRWLRRPQPDLPEVAASLERMTSEGRRAGEIVRRIRSFLGNGTSDRDRIEIAALIQEAAALIGREVERASVELEIDLPVDLPAIQGDRVQLQQVLVNIMLNAVQAMEGQIRRRRLRVLGSASAEAVEIAVIDNGPGIAPDRLQRLFEPFYTTRADGMGMGLAICRRTVESHGGQIKAESSVGDGSAFRITFPLASQDGDA